MNLGMAKTYSRPTSAPYVVKERKKIPKTIQLESEIYIEFTQSFTKGFRIAIAGTAVATKDHDSHAFLAIYNTYYNTTEFLWEDFSTNKEVCRGIKFAKNSPHGICLRIMLSNVVFRCVQ